jgi:beta-lactam-binding protein with PASTA domain
VPDVKGLSHSAATKKIMSAGLKVGKITGPYELQIIPGSKVLSTSPPAGTYVAPGTNVDLKIHSYGPIMPSWHKKP